MIEKEIIIEYLKKEFTEIEDVEYKNLEYDILADRIKIEIKERIFNPGNSNYFYANDMLVEYIQYDNFNPRNPADLHLSLGWFYKTDWDRFIYIKYLYDNIHQQKRKNIKMMLYDIDWKKFYFWLSKELSKETKFSTIRSKKTTDSWNLIIPIKNIPDNMIKIEEKSIVK